MNREKLTEAVKRKAQNLGFQLVGVTTPDPPPHFLAFERWLAAGHHGEMTYMGTERARERRADPRHILPECESILTLGIRYPSPEGSVQVNSVYTGEAADSEASSGPRGRVASYAWGDDYHDVLPKRLRALVVFIEEQVGHPFPNCWYTDTGPILERDLAERAGLGWIGKNTCLIHPKLGSYFLLAEILLGLSLEPDPPFITDYCGTCTRCIVACPTDCILPDRTLDASRCISYLTIELKGAIPMDLRPQMEDWVFGCDICQEVCPWNERFASNQSDAFAPRPGVPTPDLHQELSLTRQEFNRKFKRSPVKRTKRRGYLRNVAVALGNAGDPRSISELAETLRSESEPLVRGHAAWALGQIGSKAAHQALTQAAHREQGHNVLKEIGKALGSFCIRQTDRNHD